MSDDKNDIRSFKDLPPQGPDTRDPCERTMYQCGKCKGMVFSGILEDGSKKLQELRLKVCECETDRDCPNCGSKELGWGDFCSGECEYAYKSGK